MKMVDEKKIAFTPAVELSYLKPDEQRMLIDTIESRAVYTIAVASSENEKTVTKWESWTVISCFPL